jgi:long-subunit fatty acid transport protein
MTMNKFSKYLLITTLLTFIAISRGLAQVSITSVPFLQIEPDSRAAGMGNANVALADNASAIYWNPAGLGFQTGNQVSITHSNWLPQFNTDLFYDFLVGKYYVDGIGTIGADVTFLNLGEQQYTDEKGNNLGKFRSYEFAVGAAYGFKLNKHLSIGTGARFIYSNLVPTSISVGGQQARIGTSVSFDISSLYKSSPFQVANRKAQLNAGFDLSNLGPGIQYSDNAQKDPLPTILRVGWSYTMNLDKDGYNTITIANDFSKLIARNDTSGHSMPLGKALFDSWGSYTRYDGTKYVTLSPLDQIMIGTGIEYWYDKKFALRTGYFYESPKNGDRRYVTFGAGLRYNIFGVDFSYIYTVEQNSPLANTIRFSVLLNI